MSCHVIDLSPWALTCFTSSTAEFPFSPPNVLWSYIIEDMVLLCGINEHFEGS
jgi:hypothetical protein